MQFWDYAVLAGYLLFLGWIAWRFRKTSSAPGEFFLAGRSFGALPVGLSVMVTTFSAVNYLALPGEVCRYGLYVVASLPVFFLAAWPVTKFWMPRLLELRPVSVYAFLEERFDLRTRLLCSGLFLLWRIFWMSAALYASAKIMSVLTGGNFHLILFFCGFAAAAYSASGGMKSVVWTDVLQFCVLFGSIVLGTFLAWHGNDPGSILAESGRLKPFFPPDWNYLSPNPEIRITLWSALLGTFVAFLTRFGADQMVMQRFLAAKDLVSARRGLWVNGIASTLTLGLLVLFGLTLSVYAFRNGIPEGTPPVRILTTLLKKFPPGMSGLIAAGLLAATMSSIDSGLNSCCAALCMDFQKRLNWHLPSSGMLTMLLAVPVILSSAFLFPLLNRNNTLFVILNKTVNTLGTPLLAVMLCALFLKRVRASAVFYGTIAGIILTVLLSIFLKRCALHYYAVLSLAVSFGSIFLCGGFRQIMQLFRKKI